MKVTVTTVDTKLNSQTCLQLELALEQIHTLFNPLLKLPECFWKGRTFQIL